MIVFVEANATGTTVEAMRLVRAAGRSVLLLTGERDFYAGLAENPIYEADEVVDANCFDPVAICRALEGRTIDALLAFDDYRLLPAALAASMLGVPHAGLSGLLGARFKDRMRRLTSDMLGAVPARVVDEAAVEGLDTGRLRYPVVIKPVDESGSVGVRLCRSSLDLREAATFFATHRLNIRGYRPERRLLIEEFIDGPEYSCEISWSKAQHGFEIIGFTRKILGPPPYFVEMGHVHPCTLGSVDEDAIRRTILGWLEALELRCAAAHVEFRIDKTGGARLIEINPRLPGGHITKLVHWTSGRRMIQDYLAYHDRRSTSETRVESDAADAVAAAVRFLPMNLNFLDNAEADLFALRLGSFSGYREHKLSPPTKNQTNNTALSNYSRSGHILISAPSDRALTQSLSSIDSLIEEYASGGRRYVS
ncbi:MAG: ATP-grasp domain-containing protein [Salinarimonas sp.]